MNSLILLIFSFLLIFVSVDRSITTAIPTKINQDCEIHLKVLSNDQKHMDLAENYINKMREKNPYVVWTIQTATKEDDVRNIQAKEMTPFKQHLTLGGHTRCKVTVIIKAKEDEIGSKSLTKYVTRSLNRNEGVDYYFVLQLNHPTKNDIPREMFRSSKKLLFVVLKFNGSAISYVESYYFCPLCHIQLHPLPSTQLTTFYDFQWMDFRKFWKSTPVILEGVDPGKGKKDYCSTSPWNNENGYVRSQCYTAAIIFETIAKHLNFSLAYYGNTWQLKRSSRGFVTQNIDGNTVLEKPIDTVFHQSTRSNKFVYCDASRHATYSMIKAWVAPFDTCVWSCITLLLVCQLTLAVYITVTKIMPNRVAAVSLRRTNFNLITCVQHFLNVTCRLLFRQGLGDPTCLAMMVMLGMVLISGLYETYLTSEITVPTLPSAFNTLGELLENNYKVVLFRNALDPKVVLHDSLVKYKIRQRFDNVVETIDIVDFTEETIKRIFGENMAFLDTSSQSETTFLLKMAQKMIPKFTCYQLKEKIYTGALYWLFGIHLRETFIKKMASIRESGIQQFWDNMEALRYQLTSVKLTNRLNKSDEEIQSNLIKMKNLLPFFGFCLLIIIIASIIFAFEMKKKVARSFSKNVPKDNILQQGQSQGEARDKLPAEGTTESSSQSEEDNEDDLDRIRPVPKHIQFHQGIYKGEIPRRRKKAVGCVMSVPNRTTEETPGMPASDIIIEPKKEYPFQTNPSTGTAKISPDAFYVYTTATIESSSAEADDKDDLNKHCAAPYAHSSKFRENVREIIRGRKNQVGPIVAVSKPPETLDGVSDDSKNESFFEPTPSRSDANNKLPQAYTAVNIGSNPVEAEVESYYRQISDAPKYLKFREGVRKMVCRRRDHPIESSDESNNVSRFEPSPSSSDANKMSPKAEIFLTIDSRPTEVYDAGDLNQVYAAPKCLKFRQCVQKVMHQREKGIGPNMTTVQHPTETLADVPETDDEIVSNIRSPSSSRTVRQAWV